MKIISHCEIGIPIYLDEISEDIVYKETRVPFKFVKEAYESGYDTVKLSNDIFFRRRGEVCSYACLKLLDSNVKQLIQTTWKLLKK